MAKRKKRKKRRRGEEERSKEIPLPSSEEGTLLCIVERLLGADHLLARCADGVTRKVRIPGSMRRRVWMREGDVILVAPWDFKPDRGDAIYRYRGDEVRKLIEMGLLPEELKELMEELA